MIFVRLGSHRSTFEFAQRARDVAVDETTPRMLVRYTPCSSINI